jgi:hypothetical protein
MFTQLDKILSPIHELKTYAPYQVTTVYSVIEYSTTVYYSTPIPVTAYSV